MTHMSVDRRALLLVGSLVAVLAIAVPVLGADPSAKPGPSELQKQEKPERDAGIALALTGTISKSTDAKGRPSFTMTVAGVTWELSDGPRWYWLDKDPLAAFVGKSVQVAGTHHAGETELDVDTVDGKPLRAAGKPPWAGGPKAVGSIHPGNGHGKGHAKAPGQTKDKSGADTDDPAD